MTWIDSYRQDMPPMKSTKDKLEQLHELSMKMEEIIIDLNRELDEPLDDIQTSIETLSFDIQTEIESR